MEVITFWAKKGGDAKSTTCVNVAGILAEMKHRILLIDLDPQGNSSKVFFNDEKDKTVFNIFKEENIDTLINKTKYENLEMIVASENLSGLDLFLSDKISREKVLRKSLSKMETVYDYVLIDCSPSLNLATINALCASDYCVTPAKAELFSVQSYFQMQDTFDVIKEDLNPSFIHLGLMISMFEERLNLHKSVIAKLEESNIPMFTTKIPRSVAVAESFMHNKILIDYKPNSKGAIAYQEFVKELLEKI